MTYKYGIHFDEIEKQIYTPERQKKDWGYFTRAANEESYGLDQVIIGQGKVAVLEPPDYQGREVMFYLESGQALVGANKLIPEDTLFFPPGNFSQSLKIEAEKDSILYVFFGFPQKSDEDKTIKKATTFDIRRKDWSENLIEIIVNREFSGKKIFFKKRNNSGLNFHCQKTESYFIHSGKLLLRLRAGHAEDRYYVLGPGQAIKITPGLMHQAGGLEDTVIIESSSHDEDTDSFIVENDFNEMPRLKKMIFDPLNNN